MKKRHRPDIFVPPELPPSPSQWAAEMALAMPAEPRRRTVKYTVEETAGGCQVIRLRPSAMRSFSRL